MYAKRSVFSRFYPEDSDFLIVGGDYKSYEHKNDMNKKYNNKAFYITNNNTFDGMTGGKTILTESVRSDVYNKFDNKMTGKLGLKHFHDAIDGLTTSANVGTAYNVPTLYNLYSAYGNTDLKAENTKSYDVTIGYYDVKITYFSSVITDMIDYDFTTSSYNNLSGESKLRGYEVEYDTQLSSELLVNANYTKLDPKNSDGEVLKRRVSDTFKLSLDYYASDDLHLGVNGEYIGARYSSDDKEGQQTGKYTVANFVANYEISRELKTYFKVDNITNKYYQVVDGYASSPRSAYVGFKANF